MQFAKMYEGAEHAARFGVYKANMELIAAHNKLYEAGEETFHMAANQFADMTTAEFSKMVNGYRADLNSRGPRGSGDGQRDGAGFPERDVCVCVCVVVVGRAGGRLVR